MGPAVSTNSIDVLSQSIIAVAVKNTTAVASSIKGEINISGSTLTDSNITMDLSSLQKSLSDFQVTNEVVNSILSTMKQKAEATTGLGLAAVSQNESKLRNALTTSLSTEMISTCANTILGSINITDSKLTRSNVNIIIKTVQDCLSKGLANNSAIASVTNDIDQSAKATSSLFGDWGMIILVVILVILGGGYWFFFSESSPMAIPL